MKTIANKNVFRLFLGFSMASWISAAISFLLTPVITRIIQPDDLGKIDLFITFCNMFIYASTLGMHQSYMRFFDDLPNGFTKEKLLSFSVKVSMIGGGVSGGICCILFEKFSYAILGYSSFFIAVFMFAFILSYSILDVVKTKPRMYGNTFQYATMVVLLSISTKLAYLSYGVTKSVLFTIGIIVGIHVILVLVYAYKERNSIFVGKMNLEKVAIIKIFKYALPTVPVMFISNVNSSLPKILLNNFFDSATVGIYTGALTLVQIISLLQVGIGTFWSPYVFRNYKEKQSEIQSVHHVISYGMVLFGIALITFQDIVFYILGDSYRVGKTFYAFLLASPIFYTIGETVGIGIGIEKKTYLNIVTTASTITCNFILGVILIPRLGNIGAAISVMLSAGVMLILKAFIGEKYYRVVTNPVKTWSAPIIYIVATIVTWYFSDELMFRSILLFILAVLLTVVYIKEFKKCLLYVISFVKR